MMKLFGVFPSVVVIYLNQFTFTTGQDSLNYVTSCPYSERGWNIRKRFFRCKEYTTYHCVLDAFGQAIELCRKRKEFEKDGCPWVLEQENDVYFGTPLTQCNNKKYCPNGNGYYKSDELYSYPACLVKVEDRQFYPLRNNGSTYNDTRLYEENAGKNLTFLSLNDSLGECCECPACCECVPQNALKEDVVQVIIQTTTVTTTPSANGAGTEASLVYIAFAVVIGLLIVIAVALLFRLRGKASQKIPTIAMLHVSKAPIGSDRHLKIILRLVIKIIEVGDDHMLLGIIYEGLEETMADDYIYAEYFPTYEGKKISYLMYAAKLNRRAIVLFYLQRYLNRLHQYTSDIYGTDVKNETLLHLAIRQGWADAVRKLLDINTSYFLHPIHLDPVTLAQSLNQEEIVKILQPLRH